MVSEPKPPEDVNTPLKFSMEGYKGRPPASLIPYYWVPGWNSPQAVNKYLDEPNGSVKDGDPGIKIFAGTSANIIRYINEVPGPFKPETDGLHLVPVPQIFGSEELSSYGQAVSELITSPTLFLNEKEAGRQKIKSNDIVSLKSGGKNLKVTVRTDNTISDGIAALTVMLPGMEFIEFPETSNIVYTEL
jgi:NADH-quinone oxidoreductase subunit G